MDIFRELPNKMLLSPNRVFKVVSLTWNTGIKLDLKLEMLG